jgi:hypothetical protein
MDNKKQQKLQVGGIRNIIGSPVIGGGNCIGTGDYVQCNFRSEPLFITEDHLLCNFDATYDFGNLPRYSPWIRQSFRHTAKSPTALLCQELSTTSSFAVSEFLLVDFNNSIFLIHARYSCNSCGELENLQDQTCRDTRSTHWQRHLTLRTASLMH